MAVELSPASFEVGSKYSPLFKVMTLLLCAKLCVIKYVYNKRKGKKEMGKKAATIMFIIKAAAAAVERKDEIDTFVLMFFSAAVRRFLMVEVRRTAMRKLDVLGAGIHNS